ncbi:MAG: hypothetical protein ABSF03_34810 [Streptosporangiaceae bacterium]
MLLLLVYRLLRCLFGLPAVLVRSDLSKDAELLVLRHENQVLRRQLSGRLRWDPCRSALAYGVVPAGEPPPMVGNLPGRPSHDPALAP